MINFGSGKIADTVIFISLKLRFSKQYKIHSGDNLESRKKPVPE